VESFDTLYARLKKCADLACTGRTFTEHRNVPDLRPDSDERSGAWEQVAGKLREAIQSGVLAPGSALPSVIELRACQGIRRATAQHAFSVLAEEGLIVVRQGRTAVVAGTPPDEGGAPGLRTWRPGRGHDCALAGCSRHVCRPMKSGTIRQIHSILSGAFEAAQRWGWVDRNPADSAKPPTVTAVKRPATPPEDVAAVIAEGRAREMHQLALCLWLAAITGARRGELCAVQACDVDLEHGLLHLAFNYVVRDGQKVRKDTKTHQDRWVAIDEASVAFVREHLGVGRRR
jgi:hypothetical protein